MSRHQQQQRPARLWKNKCYKIRKRRLLGIQRSGESESLPSFQAAIASVCRLYRGITSIITILCRVTHWWRCHNIWAIRVFLCSRRIWSWGCCKGRTTVKKLKQASGRRKLHVLEIYARIKVHVNLLTRSFVLIVSVHSSSNVVEKPRLDVFDISYEVCIWSSRG